MLHANQALKDEHTQFQRIKKASIVLASGSPRRKELLAMLGLDFKVITSEVDENIDEKDPENLVRVLCKRKAQSVAKDLIRTQEHNPQKTTQNPVIVIAADTIVCLDSCIFGKPKESSQAYEMIQALQGRAHDVLTGLCLINMTTGLTITHIESTKVNVAPMPSNVIQNYIDTQEYCDKAGAYAIQGRFAKHIQSICGCYYNVMGLPLNALYNLLLKI